MHTGVHRPKPRSRGSPDGSIGSVGSVSIRADLAVPAGSQAFLPSGHYGYEYLLNYLFLPKKERRQGGSDFLVNYDNSVMFKQKMARCVSQHLGVSLPSRLTWVCDLAGAT